MEPILILTGPTAVGKTTLSLDLAERRNAEIISADSRQVYRELTIGTAKPCPEELERVPHHFINKLSLDTTFTAGAFAREAYQRIRDIRSRGRTPIVVGGSTLYLWALQFGLADIPPVDPAIRHRLEERLATEGADRLYDELLRVDPLAAARADPTKTHRVIRALEVYHGTGKPISHYYANQTPPPFSFHVVVLMREREALYDRINRRVDAMLDEGLLDEVRSLLDTGVDPAINPLQTIGYQEPIAYLKGELDYDEMVRLIKRNTRRYAKRQITWFRRYQGACFVDVNSFTVQ